jgi:UDP-N-acetylmuramoyl-L-alanyl-D-glutamate--2,6-diaminopimelate ligase
MTRAVLAGGGHRVTATVGTENGHYGIPLTLLDRALRADAIPSALVIEMGIDEIGAMRSHVELVRPDVAVITSLGEEHLRGLHDEDTAATEELALFAFEPRARRILMSSDANEHLGRLVHEQRAGDITVVDTRDERGLERARANKRPSRLEYCASAFDGASRKVAFDVGPTDLSIARSARGLGVVRVPLPSEAHAGLAALAIATGHALGRSVREIEEGFATFRPARGRAEIVRLDRDLVVVDDTFNASPGSMRLAIDLLDEPAWAHRPKALVIGDMLDLGDATEAAHASLVPRLRELRDVHVRLFGDAMEPVYRAIVQSPHELASIAHAASREDPRSLLDGPWASLEGALVVIKGSRGMHLERITAALRRAYERPRPLPARPAFAADFVTVGVTGTNGKSSTTTWIAAMLARNHASVARATTLGYYLQHGASSERLDYPFDFDGFVAALDEAHRRGARACALEVTSEALQHGFAKVWPFRVGVFTNLTHDHLDVHTTPEHYLASKAQLFMHLEPGGVAVLNACDPASALLREVLPPGVSVLTYGVASRGEAHGDVDLFARMRGGRIELQRSPRAKELPDELTLAFPAGDIFVENALAAALGAWAAGVSPTDVAKALSEIALPEGRFEIVAEAPWVIVDYAHTPDALSRTITAARGLTGSGRVLLVFGAGGDRDARKRGPMGHAARAADVIYVTSDNPRTEDPMAIARALASGIGDHPSTTIELDRARAIASAIAAAGPADVVLVCGKGHETDQTIGTTRHRFSDREIAQAAWASRKPH